MVQFYVNVFVSIPFEVILLYHTFFQFFVLYRYPFFFQKVQRRMKSVNYLEKHIGVVNNKSKVYLCKLCKYSAERVAMLTRNQC